MIWNKKEIEIILQKNKINVNNILLGASIDTRTIKRGNIFFALGGKFFNGNIFINKAIKRGASLCFSNNVNKIDYSNEKKIVVVNNVKNIINRFATFRRGTIKGKILNITGSLGKTSIKEFLGINFSFIGKTFISLGNFNNYYGALISIINCPKCIDFCILELGMNRKGEILHLSYLLKPQISMISNINAIHKNSFYSIKNITYAKTEIFHIMNKGDTIILNSNSIYFHLQSLRAKNNLLNTFTLSKYKNIKFNCYLLNINSNYRKKVFLMLCFKKYNFHILEKELHFNLILNLGFILLFLFILNLYFLSIKKVVRKIYSIIGRGSKAIFKNTKNHILDESYNSSPISLFHMINNNKISKKKRLILFAGDIKEFGKYEESLHKNLNIFKINKVFIIGLLMKYFYINIKDCFKIKSEKSSSFSFSKIIYYMKNKDFFFLKSAGALKIFIIIRNLKKFLHKI